MSLESKQFSTFYVNNRLYGIDVMKVQEIVKSMPITKIPLAPQHVYGLINLRGQIATAIGLRELFGLEENKTDEQFNVVCQLDGVLISFLVDKIGDVLEVEDKDFENVPDNVSDAMRHFMKGVYKTSGQILSILEVDQVMKALNSNVKE